MMRACLEHRGENGEKRTNGKIWKASRCKSPWWLLGLEEEVVLTVTGG